MFLAYTRMHKIHGWLFFTGKPGDEQKRSSVSNEREIVDFLIKTDFFAHHLVLVGNLFMLA